MGSRRAPPSIPPHAGGGRALPAGRPPESPESTERWMEEICQADNLKAAYRNSGALHPAFSNASFVALGLPWVAARRTP